MTLVVNLIHREFTILMADTLMRAQGRVDSVFNGKHISMNDGESMHGFEKVFTNSNGSAALAIAGSGSGHPYLAEFQTSSSPAQALKIVHQHVSQFPSYVSTGGYTGLNSVTSNEGILAIYDGVSKTFVSNVYKFGNRFSSTQVEYGNESSSVRLCTVGGGAKTLNERLTPQDYMAFARTIRSERDVPHALLWLKALFAKVSFSNPDCNSDVMAKIATRRAKSFSPA